MSDVLYLKDITDARDLAERLAAAEERIRQMALENQLLQDKINSMKITAEEALVALRKAV